MSKKLLIIIILAFSVSGIYTQEKGKDKWNFKIWEDDYFYKSRPTIDVTYGMSQISLKNSTLNFKDAGLIEMKLGYTYLQKSHYSKSISRFKNNYLFGSYISSKINTKNNPAEDKTWRFGIGNSTGYGYMLGKKSSLVLYNSNGMTWTRYDNGLQPNGSFSVIDDFNQTVRFGTGTEAGIIIPIAGFLNLQAQFDRTLVFPRHMVWKHLGSVAIEMLGQAAIDGFIREIMKSSPMAGPIINFVLKNALSYGIYELRREKMNWPFNSAEPLLFDSFKAGFTFTF
jgi:hypothetical protein